ncbi:unnamed protein product [Paramecium primaurelia]|uniref:Uncharacterized protein n=1 Tax=Paramecium primaurelia TaxID=5886 RepID=A0A8S1M1M2_PARPR|nr:unnamed protein product [Paramecium primaurelia]
MEEQNMVSDIQFEEQINDPIEYNMEKQQYDKRVFSYNSKSKKKYQKIIEKLENLKKTELKKKNKDNQQFKLEIEGDDYSEVKNNQEKLKILKEIMSSVPAYLLMSPAQKRKYFKTVNTQFYETLQKELGSQCSHQKSVQFDLNRNKIKTFKQSDNVFEISQSLI